MLYFGLPLENVFPDEGIHYGIKNFMFEAYSRISSDNIPVQDVLRKFQGSVEERLMLKHRLILGRNINKLKITPGSLLWVVRHFIGLLPIPLLPETHNKGDCLWTEITKMCKTSVVSYVTRGRYNTELVELISKKLAKLPQQSFILIVNLFDTMRMLAVLPAGEPRINKASAFALVEYFSSSLFLRPFHPGSTNKIAKQYYPVTLFLILKWTEIKNCCIQFRQNNCNFKAHGKISHDRLSTKRQFIRRSTLEYNIDVHSSDEEIQFNPSFDTTCDYLQDVACQTDNVRSKLQENCFKKCCCGMLKTHEEKHRSETKIIYIKQKCCCAYGTNYESVLSPEPISDLEEQLSNDPNPLFECKQKPSTISFADVDKEIISKIPYEKIQHFDPVEKEIADNSITKKITKVGWSYTSNFPKNNFDDDGSKHDSIESVSNIGWNLKSESDDSLESMRKSLNAELKKKFIQKEEEKGMSEEFQCSSKSSLPKVCGSVSKESRISVNKIKHKLNILKAFSDKKNNSKKSLNCKRAESKIKYKRIGSENSIDKC